jgi:hypothetical protein
LWESLDADGEDRSLQPVHIRQTSGGYFNNKLNSFMDHMWDGFYTGQVRLPRFPSQIQTGRDYRIDMTSTPPKKMRFKLIETSGSEEGMMIKIDFPNVTPVQIKVGGKPVEYTPWDTTLNRQSPLTKTAGCGENRFVGIENYVEFYITPGCEVHIEPFNSVFTNIRMEWELDTFYEDGGYESFV